MCCRARGDSRGDPHSWARHQALPRLRQPCPQTACPGLVGDSEGFAGLTLSPGLKMWLKVSVWEAGVGIERWEQVTSVVGREQNRKQLWGNQGCSKPSSPTKQAGHTPENNPMLKSEMKPKKANPAPERTSTSASSRQRSFLWGGSRDGMGNQCSLRHAGETGWAGMMESTGHTAGDPPLKSTASPKGSALGAERDQAIPKSAPLRPQSLPCTAYKPKETPTHDVSSLQPSKPSERPAIRHGVTQSFPTQQGSPALLQHRPKATGTLNIPAST